MARAIPACSRILIRLHSRRNCSLGDKGWRKHAITSRSCPPHLPESRPQLRCRYMLFRPMNIGISDIYLDYIPAERNLQIILRLALADKVAYAGVNRLRRSWRRLEFAESMPDSEAVRARLAGYRRSSPGYIYSKSDLSGTNCPPESREFTLDS
jgi:hypothetical protein